MDVLQLADWRRRVAELYAGVRRESADDPEAAHRRWRRTRDQLFGAHPQTPLGPEQVAAFDGLRVVDYDPAFRFSSPLDADVQQDRFPVGTSTGATIDFVRVGRVRVPVGTLDVYWLDAYGGGLFLPFRDATAGTETYGGGRYLLDTAKGADLGLTGRGEVVCDFNFAYNPSCHYRPTWDCPLAPPDNRLEARVPVGECAYS